MATACRTRARGQVRSQPRRDVAENCAAPLRVLGPHSANAAGPRTYVNSTGVSTVSSNSASSRPTLDAGAHRRCLAATAGATHRRLTGSYERRNCPDPRGQGTSAAMPLVPGTLCPRSWRLHTSVASPDRLGLQPWTTLHTSILGERESRISVSEPYRWSRLLLSSHPRARTG